MSFETLELTVDGGVAEVTLSRGAKLNTMTSAFWADIEAVFRQLDDNPQVRAVVLSSTGKHFTAGMDLAFFGQIAPDPKVDPGRQREQVRRFVLRLQDCFNVIENLRVPVLAAIQGGCIGGGIDMIATCDMRYCTADAFFVIQETNIGMTADLGTLQRLPHILPSGVMRELAFTGRRMMADEALAQGLVNQVFDSHDDMLESVRGIAAEIATKSPLAISGIKEMINHARDHSVREGLEYVAAWQSGVVITGDIMEAAQARATKRDPKFDDLLPATKINKG